MYDEATLEQYTQLTTAVRSGNLATVRRLVPSVFDVNLIVPREGSLLHQAVTHDRVPVAEYLLQQGADANLEDDTLVEAIHEENLPMVRLLVDNGAEINRKTQDSTIFKEAISSQNIPIIEFLLRSGVNVELACDGWKPIHEAAETGNLEIVKMLVKAGANINSKFNDAGGGSDAIYSTPLMIAAANGYSDIVKYLLNHGADYEVYDYYDMTAEDIARDNNYTEIADLIQGYSENFIKEPEL